MADKGKVGDTYDFSFQPIFISRVGLSLIKKNAVVWG
jgi:hypothetical protein